MRPALALTATTRENQRDMTALAASLPLAGLPVRFRAGLTAALAAGLAYLLLSPMLDGTANAVLKGSGATLLALSALQLRTDGARWLAAIMPWGRWAMCCLPCPACSLPVPPALPPGIWWPSSSMPATGAPLASAIC